MNRKATGVLAKVRFFVSTLSIMLTLSLVDGGGANAAEFYWNTTFNLSEQYDDNIYLQARNKQDDFITKVSQNFTLGIRTEDLEVGVNFSFGFAYYKRRESGDVRSNLNLFGARDIPLSDRLFLTLDESFRVSEDPLEFGPTEDIFDITTDFFSSGETRNRYYRNRFRGELAYRFGEEDDFYWGYRNNLLKHSFQERQDSMIHHPYAGVRYWFVPRHGVDLSLNYTVARFDDPIAVNDPRFTSDFEGWGTNAIYYFRMRPETTWNLTYSFLTRDFDSPNDPDYDVHNASIGISHQLTETLFASANIGRYRHEPDIGRSTGGPSGNVGLSKQFESGVLSLLGSWGFREQYGERENLGPSEFRRIRATYGFQATEKLLVSTGLGYYDNDYLGLSGIDRNKTWFGDVSLSYQIRERLIARLNYMHQDHRSGTGFREDYKVNRVTLMFSVPFDGRPRTF